MTNLLATLLLSSCNALPPTGQEECLSSTDSDHLLTTLNNLGHDWTSLASTFTQGVNDANLRSVSESLNNIDDQIELINSNLENKNCIDGDSEAIIDSSKQIFNTLQSNLDVFFAPLTEYGNRKVGFESSNLTVQRGSPIHSVNNGLKPSPAAPPNEQNQQGMVSKMNASMQFLQSFGKRASELLRRATRNKDGSANGDDDSRKEGEHPDGEGGEYHHQGGQVTGHETHRAADENSQSGASRVSSTGGQFAYTSVPPQFGQAEPGFPQYGDPQYDDPQFGQPQYNQPQYGQPPYGQPQYGQPQYGQPSYGQPPYGQPPYGQPPYAEPPYGQPQYAQPPPPNDQQRHDFEPQPSEPYSQDGRHDGYPAVPPQYPPNGYHGPQAPENSEEFITKLSEKTVKVVLDQLNVIGSIFTKSEYEEGATLISKTQRRVLEFANRLRFSY